MKLPNTLLEAATRRSKELGYPSRNAYLAGLLRYDLLVRGEHSISLPIARMDLDRQDRIDVELLEIEKLGIGKRGTLLEHLIDRAISNGATTKDEIKKQLPEEL